MQLSLTPCHVCCSAALELVEGFESFARVTSDCKPWPRGGALGICRDCGCVQAVTDHGWREEASQIYRNYSIWHQSGGAEQSVFDATGQAAARSWRVLDRLRCEMSLPEHGRLLDIGCGNGSLLSTAGELLPKWHLAGTEFDDKYRARIEAIPRVERLHTGPLEEVPGQFDLVTLSHVFEHLTSPATLLGLLPGLLRPQGYVMIQVPNYHQNPFELTVADHCSHFSPSSLAKIVACAGFNIRVLDEWVPREITLLAQAGVSSAAAIPDALEASTAVQSALSWLDAMRGEAERSSDGRRFGIFGTSIAGTWLYSELGDRVSFFVDEDPQRAGKNHLGIPIFLPEQAPENSLVFVALPQILAGTVASRLRHLLPASVSYRMVDSL
jgi:trans-aconitate methyltransferase